MAQALFAILKPMNSLIIGGTSGLGLAIANYLQEAGDTVFVTGRRLSDQENRHFISFDLSAPELVERIHTCINSLPVIDRLVYAAGYFQEGTVSDLSEQNIEEMINVGGRGLIYFVKSILDKQNELKELITITSTSQWTPRQKEPIYNFVKAGSAHFSNAVAEDGRVAKVLVVGPAGMNTRFWDGTTRDDLDDMLDPAWVAGEVMKLENDTYKYRFARILRQPARVEIIETRQ
jgi:short-subunit dehydrogenase